MQAHSPDDKTHAPAPPVQGATYTFLTYAQLQELPSPEWLVRRLLPKRGFCVLYGESGAGKSFVALDLALSVATGRPWAGLKVCTGPVRYIVAEGNVGFVQRIKAWYK